MNSNTGIASKVDEFNFYATNKTTHVEAVKFSAPDYSIPPTPVSSYANLHVVLDSVHPSSVVTRTGVMSSGVAIPSYNLGTGSKSFSSLPGTTFSQSPLPSLQSPLQPTQAPHFFEDSRAIPQEINPEEPMARSEEALTSLKSEIAPIAPPMVPLEEISVDSLAERTDRRLPESVDLSLVDENYERASYSKDWALLEEEERSWRMSRSVDSTWSSNWKLVGRELFDIKSYLNTKKFDSLDSLEEAERSWRMSRPLDAIWSGKWHKVGLELTSSFTLYGSLGFSAWFSNLKNSIVNSAKSFVDTVESALPSTSTYVVEVPVTLSIASRRVPAEIIELEEQERLYRMSKGVDAVLFGKWHKLGLELKSTLGVDALLWSEWLSSLKNRIVAKTSDIVESAVETIEQTSMPSISLPSMSMPSISLPSLPALPEHFNVTRSTYVAPLYADSTPIDFTFMSLRTPFEIMELEEQERAYRIAHGVNPILYGKWHQIGLELKHQYSLRPTLALAASEFSGVASILTGQAAVAIENSLENMYENAQIYVESAKEALTPAAPAQDFAVHGDLHLNFFAFTAEPIDFTFRSRRTPAYIIALEEAERADRIAHGVDAVLSGKWFAILSQSLPLRFEAPVSVSETLVESVLPSLTIAKDVLLEKTGEAIAQVEILAEDAIDAGRAAAHSRSWTGLLGSFAHTISDSTAHMVDVAKDTLHLGQTGSVASISKAEEAERVRRMNEKIDPMLMARLGRVQDELLHLTVKSV